jgi:hypothetical protein
MAATPLVVNTTLPTASAQITYAQFVTVMTALGAYVSMPAGENLANITRITFQIPTPGQDPVNVSGSFNQ